MEKCTGSANRAKSQRSGRVSRGSMISATQNFSAQPGRGMAEEKIVTEVAGRVCAIPAEAGAKVDAGENVVLVEAIKMEIGAASEKGGVVKSISLQDGRDGRRRSGGRDPRELITRRHCEGALATKQSRAIAASIMRLPLDCFAPLAMTLIRARAKSPPPSSAGAHKVARSAQTRS
jgi:hypothetical protein